MQFRKIFTRENIIKFFKHPVVDCILLAFVLNLFVDILNQRSILEGIKRLFTNPLTVLFNGLLITFTISLAGFFKRRYFAVIMGCFPWLFLAISNFILQFFRATPLSAIDFSLILSVFYIIDTYLTVFQIILIVLVMILAVVLLVFAFIKLPKTDRLIKFSSITSPVVACLIIIFGFISLNVGALSSDYSNLNLAYRQYGLPYCFLVSVVDRGIDEPKTYNAEEVSKVFKDIYEKLETNDIDESKYTVDTKEKPNIVFLQLESFIDASYLLNLEYSADPTPYFRYLKENYPSGYLTVPTFGAGTANTEFEVITGMNIDYFGTGEYPYNTVLKEKTCETLANNLRAHGYYSTAIHNNTATFYDRNLVFANMGFDRFVSSDFMSDLEYTSVGWVKDNCMVKEIEKALSSTVETDLVYAISVQPHGKYPDKYEQLGETLIDVTFKKDFSTDDKVGYTYFINQLYEVDCVLKDIITMIDNYSEPVMLVLYGDHLPNFEMVDSDYYTNNLFSSEYVIYTNYEYHIDDKDLTTYQLGSYILDTIGCETGILNALHQTKDSNDQYYDYLEMLEYDMLFGERYIWNKENPYSKTEIKFGYDDITINSYLYENNVLTIYGENFNMNSYIYINDKKQESMYINSNTLVIEDIDIDSGDIIVLSQLADNNMVLYTSNQIIVE